MLNQKTIAQAFHDLRNVLEQLYDKQEATAIAHEYLESLTGMNKTERLLNKDKLLDENVHARFQKATERFIAGEPLQYITGYQWFGGEQFLVNNNVLIPRPETEELVQWIVEEQQNKPALSIIDIGTGSGCIPISLKKKLPHSVVLSCDISIDAIHLAQQNAQKMNTPIQFIHLDFLEKNNWNNLPKTDVIVSNPPYIPISEKDALDKNVREFEPPTALFVNDNDRFIFYRNLALFSLEKLLPLGAIYCEIHSAYGAETMEVFAREGYSKIELRKDLYGNDRMLKVER
jgi:release factor glutamine methyltransferase